VFDFHFHSMVSDWNKRKQYFENDTLTGEKQAISATIQYIMTLLLIATDVLIFVYSLYTVLYRLQFRYDIISLILDTDMWINDYIQNLSILTQIYTYIVTICNRIL